MATQKLGQVVSVPAGSDLSSYQFRFVKVGSDGKLALVGDGGDADGILQDKPAAADRAGGMCLNGISKVVAGNATTCGAYGASDSTGRAVDAASGDYILGKFLEAATAAGELVSFLFRPRSATL